MTGLLPVSLGGLLGLVAGSFLATLVLRWPHGRSVARGRSRCDGCGRPLAPRELVPLLSYAVARGRCRACHAAIPRLHPGMEAGCAAIGALALAVHPDGSGLAGALFGWGLATLAVLDAEHLWLPDALTLPLAGAGLAAGIAGLPPAPADRVVGAAAGFLGLEAVRRAFRRRRGVEGLGAGDPKLFAGLGAWLGWAPLPGVLAGAALLGLGWAGWLHVRGRAIRRDTPLPFGTLLAVAGGAAWLLGG